MCQILTPPRKRCEVQWSRGAKRAFRQSFQILADIFRFEHGVTVKAKYILPAPPLV